jgi:hypothetical protein
MPESFTCRFEFVKLRASHEIFVKSFRRIRLHPSAGHRSLKVDVAFQDPGPAAGHRMKFVKSFTWSYSTTRNTPVNFANTRSELTSGIPEAASPI